MLHLQPHCQSSLLLPKGGQETGNILNSKYVGVLAFRTSICAEQSMLCANNRSTHGLNITRQPIPTLTGNLASTPPSTAPALLPASLLQSIQDSTLLQRQRYTVRSLPCLFCRLLTTCHLCRNEYVATNGSYRANVPNEGACMPSTPTALISAYMLIPGSIIECQFTALSAQ